MSQLKIRIPVCENSVIILELLKDECKIGFRKNLLVH